MIFISWYEYTFVQSIKEINYVKNNLFVFSDYMSSTLHLYAKSATAFLSDIFAYIDFSKPLDLSTPSHLYPGIIPKRFGGGGGPLYFGRSAKSSNMTDKIKTGISCNMDLIANLSN